jgi:hypothetical protein
MKVYINGENGRKLVEVKLVSETKQNLWVKLSDGNVIKRKKSRDLEKETA